MRILASAYAVCPGKGSEPGMGWNWTTSLAAHFQMEVVTELEFRDQILDTVANHPHRENLKFHFIDVGGDAVRRMCWDQGDWRFYRYYRRWQLEAEKFARLRVRDGQVDLLHQLNMIGYREPGFLWRIPGPPVVWGPVGGFGNVPDAFVPRYPPGERLKQRIKSLVNTFQYRMPRIQAMIRRSSLLLAANGNCLEILSRYAPDRTFLLNDAASRPGAVPKFDRPAGGPLRLCWVGKWMPRKALWIALECMLRFPETEVELHVVGMDRSEGGREGVAMGPNVKFHGMVSHARSLELMASCDALLFTSLHEGTPHVVLEALGCGVPVLCHDAWGQGDVIDSSCGFKVPLRDPQTSILGFEAAIRKLLSGREGLPAMRRAARARAESMTWVQRAVRMAELFHRLG